MKESGTPDALTDATGERAFDPVLLAVLANRFEAVVREMTNTLFRTGRSTVLNVARDFSCSLVTGDNELLASAEGLPVHVFGSHLQTRAMTEIHQDLRPGDAYLHNDPYLGNTHHADHTILVPVFVEGTHVFTAVAKAHQADAGNSVPTTYMPFPRDVYEEGALSFPCVKIQERWQDIDDVIRMCRRRIRVPDQWYGDYLATLGAARIAERRLLELAEKYGMETLRGFIEAWFDYSERRMDAAIRQLPSGTIVGEGRHDSFPGVPDGVPIRVAIEIDAASGHVTIDLRDNIDCVPAGVNQSEACAINNVVTGLFNVLDSDVPHNAGSFRRVTVHLRDNCVVGRALHPTSCSMATTNVADRLVNITQSAFAQLGDGYGLAEGGNAMGLANAVISGTDWRRNHEPYVNQLTLAGNGGPASPTQDGWTTWALPVCAGLLYRDSVEIDEQRYPIHIESYRLLPDSGGPGRYRGAPAGRVKLTTKRDPMTVTYAADACETPARGARSGLPGRAAQVSRIDSAGVIGEAPRFGRVDLQPGGWLVGADAGGGGYGDPLHRDPARVLADVLEGYVSIEAARDVYGCVISPGQEARTFELDEAATNEVRAGLSNGRVRA